MVKSGSMLLFRCNIIKFLNSTVDAIIYRLGKPFYFSLPGRTLFPSNGNSRLVNNLSHGSLLVAADTPHKGKKRRRGELVSDSSSGHDRYGNNWFIAIRDLHRPTCSGEPLEI
jgi:hypothetical protein